MLKAAAWICGEYSDTISAIADDDEDDDAEEAFWIEGPNGEDVRSAWRGQPVHQLVLSALLHPRATNLPHAAQCSYLQAAMKVFIRACADCDQDTVCNLVGIVRSKLNIFLQVLYETTISISRTII